MTDYIVTDLTGLRKAKTPPVWMYDTGRKLRIYGTGADADCQVHFSTSDSPAGTATAYKATYDKGTDSLSVSLPSSLLSETGHAAGYAVHAWVYVTMTDGAETVKEIEIPVLVRAKPEAISEPTEAQKTIVEEALEAAGTARTAAETATKAAETAAKAAESIPTVTVTQTDTGATLTARNADGTTSTATVANGQAGPAGKDGKDGTSPTAKVEQTTTGATITITDATGTTTATLANGKDGATGPAGAKGDKGDTGATGATGPAGKDGADGYSPEVTVTQTDTGATITITDKTGTTTATLTNGKDGAAGPAGAKGDKGDKGDTGATGPAYTLTDTDKAAIVSAVLTQMTNAETTAS